MLLFNHGVSMSPDLGAFLISGPNDVPDPSPARQRGGALLSLVFFHELDHDTDIEVLPPAGRRHTYPGVGRLGLIATSPTKWTPFRCLTDISIHLYSRARNTGVLRVL